MVWISIISTVIGILLRILSWASWFYALIPERMRSTWGNYTALDNSSDARRSSLMQNQADILSEVCTGIFAVLGRYLPIRAPVRWEEQADHEPAIASQAPMICRIQRHLNSDSEVDIVFHSTESDALPIGRMKPVLATHWEHLNPGETWGHR